MGIKVLNYVNQGLKPWEPRYETMGTKVRNHGNQDLKTWESGFKQRLENMGIKV